MSRFSRSRTVVYVSEIPPLETQASSVVIYRHLKALESEGFKIIVVLLETAVAKNQLPDEWKQILLPLRRRHYPPYRPYGVLRWLRWIMLDQLVRPVLKGVDIQCVIGLMQGEYLCGYASWLSNHLKAPLFYFYHDRGELLHFSRDPAGAARIKRQNLDLLASSQLKRVWTVCPELTYDDPRFAGKFRTVYPIATPLPMAAAPAWDARFATPVLAHAGSLYNEVIGPLSVLAEQLRAVGGRLLIFSHLAANAEKLRAAFPDVVSYEGDIMDVIELSRLLRLKASGIVVAYPEDSSKMAWSIDCFPSKLTQLVQTGLPAVIIAPPETALGRWCSRNRWSLYSPDYSPLSLKSLLNTLCSKESWTRAANESRHAAQGDFNPDKIARLVNTDVFEARAF